MNQYDVIIIGAGPSGIFCAYELIHKRPEMKVLIIEKGRRIENRQCPKRKTKVCVGCKPCSITTGFAGAGAFSDGKYNITNDFGGTLYEYIGKKQALDLMKYVDICISNEEDAKDVFNICSENSDAEKGKLNREGYKNVAKQLKEKFGFLYIAITLRESISANDNYWSGLLYDGKEYYFSKKYLMHIVDRVGGGDSFGGGLIYGLMKGYDPQKAIEFAVAASCLKHMFALRHCRLRHIAYW